MGSAIHHLAEHRGTPLGLAPSPAVFLVAARDDAAVRAHAARVRGPDRPGAHEVARPAFADHHAGFTRLWRLHGSERHSGPLDVDQVVPAVRAAVGKR